MHNLGRRESKALLQTLKPLPRHIGIPGSSVEPLSPNPFHLVSKPNDPHSISSDSIVSEVAPYLQCKRFVLPLERKMPVPPAPFVNTLERTAKSTLLCLPSDVPTPFLGKPPIVGESQEVKSR